MSEIEGPLARTPRLVWLEEIYNSRAREVTPSVHSKPACFMKATHALEKG